MSHTPNRGPFYRSPTSAEVIASYQAMTDALLASSGGAAIVHGDGPPVDGVTGVGAASRQYIHDSPDPGEATLYLNVGTLEAPVWSGVVTA
jgi:hypothetical protein